MPIDASFLQNPWILVPLVLWTGVWKALALWRAARNNSVPWFVVLFVVNSVGILEIIYLLAFGKRAKTKIL